MREVELGAYDKVRYALNVAYFKRRCEADRVWFSGVTVHEQDVNGTPTNATIHAREKVIAELIDGRWHDRALAY